MNKIITLFTLSAILFSCSASVNHKIENSKQALDIDSKVAILDLSHPLPTGAEKVGNITFGDTGFSTDCDFNSNLSKARKIARENGANILKITKKKNPDLWSTCYRMEIDFYFYKDDVSSLQQTILQKN